MESWIYFFFPILKGTSDSKKRPSFIIGNIAQKKSLIRFTTKITTALIQIIPFSTKGEKLKRKERKEKRTVSYLGQQINKSSNK